MLLNFQYTEYPLMRQKVVIEITQEALLP